MCIEDSFEIVRGSSKVIATAIHAGHEMRSTLEQLSNLTDSQRLNEEDPFTDVFASGADTSIVAKNSRFQVDLNRPRDRAVYKEPEDAWGLDLWRESLSMDEIEHSLSEYDAFYTLLGEMIESKIETHGKVILLDLHSYNHRRMGEKEPFDSPLENPEIIIGTGTMDDRQQWEGIIDVVSDRLENAVVMSRFLDVRENVKFEGGEMARWLHTHYPENVCCISLEFKKIFMNEWNGKADMRVINEIKEAMNEIINFLESETI